MNEISEALADLKANYADKLSALQDQVLKLQQGRNDKAERGAGTAGPSIRARIQAHAGWTAFKGGAPSTGRIAFDGLSVKDALVSNAGEGGGSPASGGYDVIPDRAPGLFGYSDRNLTLIAALPRRPVGSNTFTFNRLSGFTAAAAAQAHEGATKAEQSIDTTLIESPISTIAVHAGLSKQLREDDASVLQSVELLLMSTVRVKAETLLITGTGTNGEPWGLASQSTLFVPTADRLVDRIGQGVATMTNNGYTAGLVLLNPLDWWDIQAERATDGHYLAGNPARPMAPSLWGVPVIPTPAVVQGGAYIVDTRWVQVLDRQSIAVEMGYSGTDFVQNVLRVLAECRLGLAVFDLAAVYRLTVGSP